MTRFANWRAGLKLVCVRGGCPWLSGEASSDVHPAQPSEGAVYTLRDIEFEGSLAFVRLVELANPIYEFGEAVFLAEQFRPVLPLQTDISAFTAMLDSHAPMLETVQ